MKMKRFSAILLAALLLTACLSLTAFAAGTAEVTVSNVQAKAGQEVAVTFQIGETSFASYGLTIIYDDAVMTLTEIRAGTGYSGMLAANPEYGIVGYANSHDQTVSGELFTAVFRVAEDAPDGVYPVGLEVDFIADAALEDLAVTVTAGSVTIGDVEAESVPPAPTEEMTYVPPEGVVIAPDEEETTEPVPGQADDSIQETHSDVTIGADDDTAAPADNTPLYIAAGVLVLAVIAMVVILISKRRMAK